MDRNKLLEQFLAFQDDASNVDWDDFQANKSAVSQFFRDPDEDDLEWIFSKLGDKRNAWFISLALTHCETLPDKFLKLLVEMAYSQADPSARKYYLFPANRAFGQLKVCQVLFEHLRKAEPSMQPAIIDAFYWSMPIRESLPNLVANADRAFGIDPQTTELVTSIINYVCQLYLPTSAPALKRAFLTFLLRESRADISTTADPISEVASRAISDLNDRVRQSGINLKQSFERNEPHGF